jgi:hypothetical protein
MRNEYLSWWLVLNVVSANESELLNASSLSAPPAPDGYAAPDEFSYPTAVLLIGSTVLGLVSMALVGTLLSAIHGPALFAALFDVTVDGETTTFAMDLTAIAVPVLLALVVTVVAHEWLHGLVFRYYGYDVSYGFVPSMGAFYAAAFEQFHDRDELLRIGLAPLVVITAVCLPLLAVPISSVAMTAALVLVVNTAGAVGDLYLAWRLWRLPPNTLMHDVDIRHSYVYEPL